MRRGVLLAVVALGVAGCSGSAGSHSATGLTPPASVASTATSAASAPADGLTGFGATQAAWDAHHTADTGVQASGSYNPDPALPKTKDGAVNDAYVAVTTDGGRVDAYFLRFTARSTADALAKVEAELPPDATLTAPVVTSGLVDSKCLILTATSPTIGKALGGADGSRVGIELQSWDATHLDQSAIASAVLVTADKGDAPGC